MKKLTDTFTKMITRLGGDFPEETLTALFPIEGENYRPDRELMVCGRAVNSWGIKEDDIWWKPKEGKPDHKTIERIIDFSARGENGDSCPMKWIADHWGVDAIRNRSEGTRDYNMKKSAFWRVIKEILIRLNITTAGQPNWPSYLVWTNLYKIAPSEGGNPSAKLCNKEFKKCMVLLAEEIRIFNPKRILFLTGYDWFKDFEEPGFIKINKQNNLVEWIGKHGRIDVVVAKHPQGKHETKYVDEVTESFYRYFR